MPVKKTSTFSLPILAALLAPGPGACLAASQDAALQTIPVDEKPVTAVAPVNDPDQGEDNTRSFNTPTDDGRPGEYYFTLGVQAAKKGDYAHAMAMYRVAASWAYKPAQYNLGVMYLAGQGTPVDLPTAMAWMALAAERGDAPYVRAKQLVYAHLTSAQFDQANAIWRDLRPTYGDEAALPRAKARWHEALANATGSRVGSNAAHVMVGGASGLPNHMNSPNYDVHDGGHISTNPAELAGVHMGDGAVAYQALRTSDNPYDPKVMPVSGVTSVGKLTQVSQHDGDATKNAASPSAGNEDQSHP
ncbi:tetratricopeptide repeat protein [Dyella sp. C9]|uniref:tetratricopeptide repeat protein n=1 Tax=Dyella sp. C9 TaxID=2202154 RepID=UPI000DEEB570|nr:SEL1-like repeat protein [Dyella sp. C9]